MKAKKLLALVLALVLCLGLAAFPVAAEEVKDAEGDIFAGQWTVENLGRPLMEITPDGNAYNVKVDWANGYAENVEWVIRGSFDEAKMAIVYTDGVKSVVTYDSEGNGTAAVKDEHCSGTIALKAGQLFWLDSSADFGEEPVVLVRANTAPTKADGAAPATGTSFVGVWTIRNIGRPYVEIVPMEEEGCYSVKVHWANGASESYDWDIHADFNADDMALVYADGVKSVTTFDDAENSTTKVVDEHCTGAISLVDGQLYWMDSSEGFGDEPVVLDSEDASDDELPAVELPFTDVTADDWYYDALVWIYSQRNPSADMGTTFGADMQVNSRAGMVNVLWSLSGSPEATLKDCPFTDIAGDSPYLPAILWAVEKGIVNGTGNSQFAPDALCTRAMLVTMLYRLSGQSPEGDAGEFSDVADGAWYAEAVAWAFNTGVIVPEGNTGNGGLFDPDTALTNAQATDFLYRYFA